MKGENKNGFTLAEVLITLGIIGVVAAMTIPTMVQNYQLKILQTQFKHAYSDLNQASKLFELHNDMSVSQYTSENGSSQALKAFKNEFLQTLKTSSLMWSSTDDEGNSIGAAPYEWTNITGSSQRASVCDASGFFWDTLGRVISFDDAPASGDNGPKVCIDINGEKGPNRYGLDYFVFVFTTDGYVIPWGQEHKNNPSCTTSSLNCTIDKKTNCKYPRSSISYQYSCSNYALSNSHPENSGKDYWHDFVKGN